MSRSLCILRATVALCCSAPLALAFQTEEAKLTDPGGSLDDRFGGASDIDGSFAVVGAAKHGGPGAAFVYQSLGGSWTLDDEVASNDALASQWFGGAVAISGTTLVVGARHDPENGFNTGAAYVFERTGSGWVQQQKFVANDFGDFDWFGHAVAIEGDTIVVGAPFKNGGAGGEGAAYVFVRTGSTWTQQQKLLPNDPGSSDLFGWSVAISGQRAIVGSRYEDQGGLDAGAAYVFLRTGTTWAEEDKLFAADADADDSFGTAVDISGNTALIGAILDEDNGAESGAAYVFTRSGSNWSQSTKLTASDGAADDLFGNDVALDGTTAIVCAFHTSSANPDTGAAYVFEFDGVAWGEDAKLVGGDSVNEDWFGSSVGFDGSRAIVGAQADDDKGSAYVFSFGAPLGGFCFGDGAGSPCPCGNESAAGAGTGCVNSSGLGGRLDPSGTSSVAADDLSFDASQLLPNQPALLFAGESAIAGGDGIPFGDGLRCAGLNVVRLGVEVPNAGGLATWGPGLGAQGGWNAGDTRFFQAWYRDPSNGPCGQGFNLSNGLQVDFVN